MGKYFPLGTDHGFDESIGREAGLKRPADAEEAAVPGPTKERLLLVDRAGGEADPRDCRTADTEEPVHFNADAHGTVLDLEVGGLPRRQRVTAIFSGIDSCTLGVYFLLLALGLPDALGNGAPRCHLL